MSATSLFIILSILITTNLCRIVNISTKQISIPIITAPTKHETVMIITETICNNFRKYQLILSSIYQINDCCLRMGTENEEIALFILQNALDF